jgi:hypothetical protein
MTLLKKRSEHIALRITSPILGMSIVITTIVASANFGLQLVNAQTAPHTSHAPSGWFLAGSKPANYDTGVDKETVNNGEPSAFLRSTTSSTEGFGTLMQSINATNYAGKRVRLRAWVKSQEVADWAGVWMRVDKDKTAVAFDNMQNRPVKGNQPWSQYDVVLDVPQDSTGISFGVLLSGTGEVWINDITFEIVGNDVPVTAPGLVQHTKLPDQPTNLRFTE